MTASDTNRIDEAAVIALGVLGWILEGEARAERFLSLTGLDVRALRARAGDRDTLAAAIRFIENHEPDLVACADALAIEPETMVAARRTLEDE